MMAHCPSSSRLRQVDCCRAGCVAFAAGRRDLTACDVCGAERYRANGLPKKQTTYWPLLLWLRMMLADFTMGEGMIKATEKTRQAAASASPEALRDWFDGATSRKLVTIGYFSNNTCIALSISTDGLQAWKQRGFHGWPIIAIILNIDPESRVQALSQLLLGVTPGPREPADLE